MENIFLHKKESFYLQGIVSDITEQDTSFLNCEHRHMIKSGAPPDKVKSPVLSVTYIIPWFHMQN